MWLVKGFWFNYLRVYFRCAYVMLFLILFSLYVSSCVHGVFFFLINEILTYQIFFFLKYCECSFEITRREWYGKLRMNLSRKCFAIKFFLFNLFINILRFLWFKIYIIFFWCLWPLNYVIIHGLWGGIFIFQCHIILN